MRLNSSFQPSPALWFALIFDAMAWLLLVALPTGVVGEEILRRRPTFPSRLMLPIVGLVHFTVTSAACGGAATLAESLPNALPASNYTVAILIYALADGLSGIVFWWTLGATRRTDLDLPG